MPKKNRKPASNLPRYIPCGRCIGGLVRVQRGSGYVMVNCQCMNEWKGLKAKEAVVDRKAKAAND